MPSPRKIHITPSQRKCIVESVNAKYETLDKLPLHISDDVDNKETPLSNNSFFPFEDRTFRKLLIERFAYLSDALDIKDVETLQNKTSKLFSVLRKREENIIPQLENLCYNFVQEIFGNSEDDFDYDGRIVNNVKDKAFVVTPKTGSEPIPQDNAINIENFDRLLKKRMFVNALIVGFANFSTYYMLKEHKAEIDKYGDGLADMYREAMLLNEYDAFLSDPEITDEDNKQGGYSETILSTEENSSKITCRAILFPILLYESIKAVMDIFASFCLPEDKNLAKIIVDKADTLVNDVWYFRVGTQLWKKFIEGVDFDSHTVPYFMKRFLSLKDNEISEVVHEVLLGTERGRKILTNMFKASARDMEYGDFEQDIINRQYQQSLIIDSQDDEQFFLNENKKKTVILSEAQKKYILTESQESKSISAAKKLLMDKLGYNEQQADEFVRIKLRNDLPVLRTPQGGKFILGVTRMFIDGQLRSANDISNLNSTLKLVASDAHINEYNRDLNGLSCSELIERFSKARAANLESEKDEVNAMVFDENSQYDIVRIDSFEQAQEYGRYTSWCVTHSRDMFDSYTSDGINQFYFCLRHGFENVREIAGEGCPLDDYGLSMIAVCVDGDGVLNTCTCRWNHDNGGNDSIMSTVEISRVVGINFFNTFKPNGKWQEILNTALSRLQNGESPKNVFNEVGNFQEGFAKVKLGDKWNFINRNGEFLSQKWFDLANDFKEGFARVKLGGRYNFLTHEGGYLSQQWFDWAYKFQEGFAKVELGGRYNFLTRNDKFVSQQWFDDVNNFSEGFATVKLNGTGWNFINRNGKYLSQQWFVWAGNFQEGFAWVKLDGSWKLRYLDRNSKLWDKIPAVQEGMKKKKRKIILSEAQKKYILAESQESKSISAAKKLLMDKLGYDEQQADEFVRIKLRNDLPVLRTPQGGKFILGVTRMFVDGQLRSANDISNLNSTLKLVASDAHINEYDRNLNGLSCSELIERFSKARAANLESEKDEVNAMVFDENSQYDIVRIDSFEQARKYGRYTSWCVTHSKNMFDSYTSDGINQFYFCLRNGFKNVREIAGEGCPLDDYGLSMIAVCVNEEGALNTCTCRWNHDNGGNDSIMSAVEISRIVGVNFFNTFKPNGKWQEILNTALSRLQGGESPENVFDGVGDFSEGFARVKLNDKWNFLTHKDQLFSQKWFDWAQDFHEGFAGIKLGGRCNFLTREGGYLSQQWFDGVGNFQEGFATVRLDDKGYNFLTRNGELVSQQWFDLISSFKEGLARVYLNGKGWNFINSNGELVFQKWFDDAWNFYKGFAVVKLNGLQKFLDRSGKLWDEKPTIQEDIKKKKRKTIVLSEAQKKYILAESQESKSISAAKKLLANKLGYDEQQADEFVRIKLRNDLPVLRTPQGGKFILGVTRMFVDGQLRSANDISNLNSTLKLVASDAHINEYDRDLNGLSCSELIERFSKARAANLEAEKDEVNAMVFNENSQYDIVRIDSFEQARKYGGYTSWCVTHSKNMFDSYTSDGINQFYFCLRNGFENVREIAGEGCPLDDYGLSMIAVCVDSDGVLNTCTCRWNHDNGGNDSIMSAVEISRVVGVNFFNTFKPNSKWQEILSTALSRLQSGESPENVFDYWAGDFIEGLTMVILKDKWNFINRNSEFLSQQWFDWANNFCEGFARVKLGGRYNFLTHEGRYLSQQWFDGAGVFFKGFAMVRLDDKGYNFLTRNGGYLSQKWFDEVGNFREGFAMVRLNSLRKYLDRNGKLWDKIPTIQEDMKKEKRKIILSEVQKKYILAESQESKSISAAKKLLMDKLGYDEQQADEFVRIELRNDLPVLRTPQGGKFILGVTRMFIGGQLRSANDISNLNSTLKLVASDAHINEYNRDLNGLSCSELIERFSKARAANLEAEKDEINAMVFDENSQYDIVRIDSFEQARKYGRYTSWCVTHSKNMFDSYTSDGINQFYFCLRNGFKNVREIAGEGCPLDDYGLSMIAVCVNEEGALNTCTCRWNHDNGGNDSIMPAVEISRVVGVNFFNTFKPNGKWQEILSTALSRLQSGESPENVFDEVGDFSEGFARVKLNDKWNFLTHKGQLFSQKWFDWAQDFHEGFAGIKLGGRCNFLTREGGYLSQQWFDWVGNFHEGFAKVKLGNKWNFITRKDELLSQRWFNLANDFSEDLAMVYLNDKGYNFLTRNGELVSQEWFEWISNFQEGFTMVFLRDKGYNFLTRNGELVSQQWFDWVGNFHEGFARVRLSDKGYNFLTRNGEYLSQQWFDKAWDFYNGIAVVKSNGLWKCLDRNSKLWDEMPTVQENMKRKIILSEEQKKYRKL